MEYTIVIRIRKEGFLKTILTHLIEKHHIKS